MRPVLRRGLTADATRSTRKPPLAESPLPQPRGMRPPPPGVRTMSNCDSILRSLAPSTQTERHAARGPQDPEPRGPEGVPRGTQEAARAAGSQRLKTRGAAPLPQGASGYRLGAATVGPHEAGGLSLSPAVPDSSSRKLPRMRIAGATSLPERPAARIPGAAERGRPLKRLRLTSQSNAGCRDLHALCVRIVGGWNTGRSRVVFLPSTWVAFKPLGAEEGHPASK
jgi:hypothetical protein